jgi:hypothetical protein
MVVDMREVSVRKKRRSRVDGSEWWEEGMLWWAWEEYICALFWARGMLGFRFEEEWIGC